MQLQKLKGRLIIHPLAANLLQYMCAQNYENRLTYVERRQSGPVLLSHRVDNRNSARQRLNAMCPDGDDKFDNCTRS